MNNRSRPIGRETAPGTPRGPMVTLFLFLIAAMSVASAAVVDNQDWSVQVAPSVGALKGTVITFGEFRDANDGFDFTYDAPILVIDTPPPVRAYFDHPEWQRGDQKFWIDIKKSGAQRQWVITTTSAVNADNYILDWDLSKVPADIDLTMRDNRSGQRIDMRQAAYYQFAIDNVSARTFTVTAYNPQLDACPNEDASGLDANGDGCIDADAINLSVALAARPDPVVVGEDLTYSVTVSNSGTLDADGVVLTAVLPKGVGYRSDTGGCDHANGTLTCGIGFLARGSSVTIDVTVIPQVEGEVSHTVTVATTTSGDISSADDSAIVNTRVISALASGNGAVGGGSGASGGGCFIATAAYGSYLAPQVMVLREFRDRFLLTNAPGRGLVRFYYAHSPALAAYIADREWLRVATRWVLTPVVMAVAHPLVALLLMTAMIAWRLRRAARPVTR